jgi:hypothetical protein
VCSALVALINISVVCPLMTWCGWWTITLRVDTMRTSGLR